MGIFFKNGNALGDNGDSYTINIPATSSSDYTVQINDIYRFRIYYYSSSSYFSIYLYYQNIATWGLEDLLISEYPSIAWEETSNAWYPHYEGAVSSPTFSNGLTISFTIRPLKKIETSATLSLYCMTTSSRGGFYTIKNSTNNFLFSNSNNMTTGWTWDSGDTLTIESSLNWEAMIFTDGVFKYSEVNSFDITNEVNAKRNDILIGWDESRQFKLMDYLTSFQEKLRSLEVSDFITIQLDLTIIIPNEDKIPPYQINAYGTMNGEPVLLQLAESGNSLSDNTGDDEVE